MDAGARACVENAPYPIPRFKTIGRENGENEKFYSAGMMVNIVIIPMAFILLRVLSLSP